MFRLSQYENGMASSIEGGNPAESQQQSLGQNLAGQSQGTDGNDPWVLQDPLSVINLGSDEKLLKKSDASNRESEREKAQKQLKSKFQSLKIPTIAENRANQEKLLREMPWQERQAFTSQKKFVGIDPTQLARQKAIREREKSTLPVLFDAQLFEAYRFKQNDTVVKNKDGTPQLKRAPLASVVCGLHEHTKIVLEQTFPERVNNCAKAFPLNESHKKLKLKDFQIAALKQHAHFFSNQSALLYNVVQTMIREGRFEQMNESGSLYAQVLSNLLVSGFHQHEALKNVLSNFPTVQLSGKKYLDLHPGSASKNWFTKEDRNDDLLERMPLPHPQAQSSDYLKEMKKLGFSFEIKAPKKGTGKTNQQANNSNQNSNKNKRKRTGNNNPKSKKKKKGKAPLPFWKKKDWKCAVCKVTHPKGHMCKEGIAAGYPKD